MNNKSSKTVVILSGGLDSATLLYHMIDLGHEVKALSVNYGQRHLKELDAARRIARMANIEHEVVEVPNLALIFGRNAVTNTDVAVPHGSYAPETMEATTVPNRNMIMLSIATGWAISLDYDSVAFGAHGGEYMPYPDCQPQFVEAINRATQVCDLDPIEILAPFVRWNKGQIVKRGSELGVPFALTWSCYEGGQTQCGKCSTCMDRKIAFEQCGLVDPVPYLK